MSETSAVGSMSRRLRRIRAGWPATIACLAAAVHVTGCGEKQTVPEGWGGDVPKGGSSPGYVLVWSDEFDGTAIDPSKWAVVDRTLWEALNSTEALDVRDGILTITTFTGQDGIHRTGMISTEGRFAAQYGLFQAHVRFRGAGGVWCAWFLWPPTFGDPPDDVARAGVEIDIVEHRAFDRAGKDIKDRVAMTLNWKMDKVYGLQEVLPLPNGAPVDGAWHTFAALWTDKDVTFYVDDMVMWKTDAAVSKRPQDLFLGCGVEHESWAWRVPEGGYGSREISQVGMDVDWVRVWQQRP